MSDPASSVLTPFLDPVVLLYHRVCADAAWRPSPFLVTATVFREQMSHLAESGYYTPRLSEVLARGREAPRASRRPILLTFDDGYADTFEYALPILREFGLTATVFPVLGTAGNFSWWESDPALRAPVLTRVQMRSMEEAGLEFGSHTLTHPRLTLTRDDELSEELVRSREVLASIVSRPLPVLAYPYGEVDERVKRATRDAGYAAAFSVGSGPLDLWADPLEIRRLPVSNATNDLERCGVRKLLGWSKWKFTSAVASVARRRGGAAATG